MDANRLADCYVGEVDRKRGVVVVFYIFERLTERVRRVPTLRPLLGLWWRRSVIRSQQLPREWLNGSVNGFLPEDLLDVAFAFHAENPDRRGCPAPQVLRELAARNRAIDNSWYHHLQSCSNCYRQVRASQHVLWPGLRPSPVTPSAQAPRTGTENQL